MPSTSPVKQDPYVGPRPFTRGDEHRFFGREREARELLSLIISHQAVLLYSQSGAGKTSLLNALVIPLLEKRGWQVLGPARVSGELPAGLKHRDIRNIFTFNAIMTLERTPDPRALAQVSLADHLAARKPAPLPDGSTPTRVLIFDQFEEILTTSPGRWQDRAEFFEDLGIALDGDPLLRVVFSAREEYLAGIDAHASFLPERLRTRLALERLREEPAMEAVTRPLEGTGRRFAPGAAEKLVRNLLQVPIYTDTGTTDASGEFVEPLHLQVACKNLWQRLPPEVTVIDAKRIEEHADIDAALSSYYDDCVRTVAEQTQVAEGVLRRWFDEKLITEQGTRGIVSRGATTTGDLPNNAVDALEALKLIRPEIRGGIPWYELTHDRFIRPIRRSNRGWFRLKGDLASQWLETRAEAWGRWGRGNSYLLTGRELADAEELLRSAAAHGQASKLLKEFVELSRARERRTLQRRVGMLAVLLVVAAGAVLLSVVAVIGSVSARRQAENATLVERARSAKYLLEQGKPFDALVLNISAVAEGVRARGWELPAPVVGGLRETVAAVGSAKWLRDSSPVQGALLSPDGSRAAVFTAGRLVLWGASAGTRIQTLDLTDATGVESAQFSPDGRWLLAHVRTSAAERSYAQTAAKPDREEYRVWDGRTGAPNPTLSARLKDSEGLSFSQDGSRVLSWTRKGEAMVLAMETGEPVGPVLRSKLSKEATWIGAGLSPDGQRVVAISAEEGVKVWDTAQGSAQVILRPSKSELFNACRWSFSLDSKRFAMVCPLPQARGFIADLEHPSQVVNLSGHISDPGAVLFSPEGDAVLVVDHESVARFSAAKGEAEPTVRAVPQAATRLVRGDGTVLLLDYTEKASSVRFWDVFTGNVVEQVEGVPGRVSKASFSRTSHRILTVSDDLAQIWDTDQPRLEASKLSAHELYMTACRQLIHQPEMRNARQYCSP